MAITQKAFQETLFRIGNFDTEKKLSVAVSGGGDSMALAFLLSQFCAEKNITLHVLSVNHALRAESADEAKKVGRIVKSWPNTKHKILTWQAAKPKTRIQEEARAARYALMADYCAAQKIKYLFLAHHGDDQVETFLFRLAKGSGIDGLGVMPDMQERNGILLVRPLLDVTHEDLMDTCRKNNIEWIEDPSNGMEKYARVRLRNARDTLAAEGLTPSRILTLAKRMARASDALDRYAAIAWDKVDVRDGGAFVPLDYFLSLDTETGLRVVRRAISAFGKKKAYPASLQQLENIVQDIYANKNFRAATLGGCIIRVSRRRKTVEITPE